MRSMRSLRSEGIGMRGLKEWAGRCGMIGVRPGFSEDVNTRGDFR